MPNNFSKVQWLHFDNDYRFQVFSDGDGHYQVRDTTNGSCVLETIAADYAAMKAKELNANEHYLRNN